MALSQTKSPYSFRAGATLSFGMSNIANNNVGLGGLVGAERRINKLFTIEAEGTYSYIIGDDVVYPEGKNKSFAIPILAGLKLSHFPIYMVQPGWELSISYSTNSQSLSSVLPMAWREALISRKRITA